MGDFREPQSANEAILQNFLGADNELREPQSVIEDLLQQILLAFQGMELPDIPEEVGEYSLKCTVTSEGHTLSWEAEGGQSDG